jgi:hypothetical protein
MQVAKFSPKLIYRAAFTGIINNFILVTQTLHSIHTDFTCRYFLVSQFRPLDGQCCLISNLIDISHGEENVCDGQQLKL